MTREEIKEWFKTSNSFGLLKGQIVKSIDEHCDKDGYIPILYTGGLFYYIKVTNGVTSVDYDRPVLEATYD